MCLLNIINHQAPPDRNVCLPLPPAPARTHCGSSLSLPLRREWLRSCVPSNVTAHPQPRKPSPAPRMDEASALSSTSPRPPASSRGTAHHQHFILSQGTCAFVSQMQRDFYVHLVGNRGPSRDPLTCILASCRHAPCASHRPGLGLGQAGAHISKPWSPRRSGHPEDQAGEGSSARASAGSTGHGVRHTHHSRRASAKAQKEERPLTGGCRRRSHSRAAAGGEATHGRLQGEKKRCSPSAGPGGERCPHGLGGPSLVSLAPCASPEPCGSAPDTNLEGGPHTPTQPGLWMGGTPSPRANPKSGLTQLLPGGL